jgi:hypothetical protein
MVTSSAVGSVLWPATRRIRQRARTSRPGQRAAFSPFVVLLGEHGADQCRSVRPLLAGSGRTHGQRRLRAEAVGVVAGGGQHVPGDVGADAGQVQQGRSGGPPAAGAAEGMIDRLTDRRVTAPHPAQAPGSWATTSSGVSTCRSVRPSRPG